MTRPARLQLRDLVADPATGRLSHTRLWSNVGLALACVVFVRQGWTGQMSSEFFGIFLAGVCGNAAVSKFLSMKYQAQGQQASMGGMGGVYGGGYGQGYAEPGQQRRADYTDGAGTAG